MDLQYLSQQFNYSWNVFFFCFSNSHFFSSHYPANYHGEVMKWQNPIKEGHQKNVEALTRINKLLEVTKLTPEQRTEAMLLIDKAGEIIKQVQDDGSWGVHAFNYTKQRVETAQAYLTKAQSIIDQGGYKAVKATK